MEANAPEKLYIALSELTEDGRTFVLDHRVDYPICTEYINKDAFIEKVCNLLARMVWEVTYEDLEGDSTEHYDKMEFIEDFKKYLRGE